MELQEIEVFIEQDGQVRVEVRGVKGPSCLALTQELERALGGVIVSRDMTAEAHETVGDQAPDQNWQRS